MTRSIVVADDDQDIVTLVKAVLADAGFEVHETVGAHTLDTVAAYAPDLVMLDYNMPEMTGAQVARLLRADPAWEKVPIVMMSGVHQVEQVCSEVKADGCLAKPFAIDDLLSVVQMPVHSAHSRRSLPIRAGTAPAPSMAYLHKRP